MKLNRFLNRISILLQAMGCIVLYFVMEAICRHSFYESWTYMTERPLVFLYNTFFIFTTYTIVYLFRRRIFMRLLCTLFWLTLAIIDGVLLTTRVTPFTGPDLHMITDALKIAEKYLPAWGVYMVVIMAALAALLLIFVLIKAPKYKGPLKYRYNLPLIILCCIVFVFTTQTAIRKRVLSQYFGNIAFAYLDYGYPYCLATTIFNTGISMPTDYSEQTIRTIEKSEDNIPQTTTEKRPNIIFIQLESFMDPELVKYLKLSEDPIPYFRSLMKNYSSGYFKVPAVGAGTCNTEFECITGMSMHYFGPGEYPYKSILTETTCESAPYVLQELGYSTHAIHNNEANFYGRKNIYPNLGFETFTSEEYMPRENEINPQGWVKDCVLEDEIIKTLDSTEGPDYIYTVSVQGHGSYPEEEIIEEPEITAKGSATDGKNNQWTYYVNQIHEMDQFVESLTESLSHYGEDVVLVMYGDHLPTMGLTIEDMENRYLFQTQYVIWDNFGLEKRDTNLAAYQIAAEVMDRIGFHEGTIFRYHQARKNSKNYQVDLEVLQYDLLYGSRYSYDGENPYQRTAMRLGLYDNSLESIALLSDLDYTYCLRGTNYTPSSEVKLNGEWYDTVYVNPNTLMITGTQLNPFDRITVCQRSNSSTRRSLSKCADRSVYALMNDQQWRLPTYTQTEVDEKNRQAEAAEAAYAQAQEEKAKEAERTAAQNLPGMRTVINPGTGVGLQAEAPSEEEGKKE